MFSALGLFKRLPCPESENCPYGVCLFSHDHAKLVDGQYDEEPPVKRQKTSQSRDHTNDAVFATIEDKKVVSNGSLQVPRTRTSSTSATLTKTPASSIKSSATTTPNITKSSRAVSDSGLNGATPVSPPRIASRTLSTPKISSTPSKTAVKAESLVPRSLQNAPATIPIRSKLLLLVYNELKRLNGLITTTSKESPKAALALSDQEIITLALDEEQNIAKANPKVYANIMKNRIGALRKLDLKGWIAERLSQIQRQLTAIQPASNKRKITHVNARVATGLSYKQEIAILSHLISPKDKLESHGYVTTVPSALDIAKARAGAEAAYGWEMCDRCGSRFKAYPTRQESDGLITTGGTCRHHWGRLLPQPRGLNTKAVYSCCQLTQGEPGCDEKPTHVFKVSNPARLASILQFKETPIPENEDTTQPVCFDCEMAYTSYGMELIRLTATAWPSGDPLLDVLVRPLGEVLDLNTRFSGVSIEQWTQAKAWSSTDLPPVVIPGDVKRVKGQDDTDISTAESENVALPIVASPRHARDLLFKLVSPTTPLMGHALENDLIAVRIVHPTIIDTVILYPHKRGLPLKNKLKFLVRDECNWIIQESGADGHDSLEDALAAGELIRQKVRIKWSFLQRTGWHFEGDKLCSPESKS